MVFFLKLCCYTFCCVIDVNILSSTYFSVSTFTLLPALIPVTMLRKLQLSLNEIRDSRNFNSSHASAIYFPCLAVVKSLCYPLVLYCTPVHCIIYLSANRVRHQPDEVQGKPRLHRFHRKVASLKTFLRHHQLSSNIASVFTFRCKYGKENQGACSTSASTNNIDRKAVEGRAR